MARIVVSGYVVRHPLAGNVWAHLQYVLGFARLGHEVWFVEEAGWENSCYDPEQADMTSDPAYGVRFLSDLMERLDLAGQWAYRDWSQNWHGLSGQEVDDILGDADLFIEIGGASRTPGMERARHRAYVDMDPVFTQLGGFGHWHLEDYDTHFTYGTNIGTRLCPIPTLGFRWHPLLPPVVVDLWEPPSPVHEFWPPRRGDGSGLSWTTIANWTAYGEREYGGETYGQKDVEFMKIIDLPRRTRHCLEVALAGSDLPIELFLENGWHLGDPLAISRDPWRYREYIWSSHGEFSVAKHGYVKSRSGWFSDRTAAYLAAGRPAVVQDTGIEGALPVGCGLMVFRQTDDAIDCLDRVASDYPAHHWAAREIAKEYLDAGKVLTHLLEVCDA